MDWTMEKWDRESYEAAMVCLRSLGNAKTKSFTEKLTPGSRDVVGMKIPDLRGIAKKIAKGDLGGYLCFAQARFYEETLLWGLVVDCLKGGPEEVFPYARQYLAHADNWALVDTFCMGLKAVKKDLSGFYRKVVPLLSSENPWEVRAALVFLLAFYVTPEYIADVLQHADEVQSEHYYVRMANAWLLSVCFVKFPQETFDFFTQCHLDDFTYNKAIQKTLESFRVPVETKERLRQMKRK